MNASPRHLAILVLGALLALAPAAAPARAAGDGPPARGVVDGSFLEQFAPADDDSGTFVEVSLSGPLLEMAAQVLEAQDRDLANLVRQLHSINTWVIDAADEDDEKLAAVAKKFREMAGQLRKQGWQPLARVRDEGDEIHVLLLSDGKNVEGLTVMVHSADGEVVFANIAGRIDLARLGEVLGKLNVPGVGEALAVLPPGQGTGKGDGTRSTGKEGDR